MRIQRQYMQANIEQLFFPVEEHPVQYWDSARGQSCDIPRCKAIVDAERGTPLSVVSKDYRLVTNEAAFKMVAPIASEFFGGNGLRDFECFNVLYPKTRSFCRVDLTRRGSCEFELPGGEKYIAFIRMTNSYNRLSRLTLIIGFCRWICLNGCIFGERSFTLSVNHTDRRLCDPHFISKVVEEARREIGSLAEAKRRFADAASILPQICLTNEQIRGIFCLVNGVSVDAASARSLPEKRRGYYLELDSRLDELVASYTAEFGNNAYAAFNVLTDYASYPRSGSSDATRTPAGQSRAGRWLCDFSRLVRDPGFDIKSYIGSFDESQNVLGRLKDFSPRGDADASYGGTDASSRETAGSEERAF